MSLMREEGELGQVVTLLNLLGLTRRTLGEIDRARSSFEAALELARKIGRRRSEASALNNLALLEKGRGEHHKAIERYRQALGIWRSSGRRRDEAVTLHNLGVVFSELGQHEEALDWLEESLRVKRELGQATASTLIAIGWSYHLAGDSPTALRYVEEAVQQSRAAGDRYDEAAALDRLGSILHESGREAAADEAYRSALRYWKELGSRFDAAATKTNLGRLLQSRGRSTEAIAELESARALLLELDSRDGLLHALVGLAEAERDLGRLRSARGRMEEALAVVDSLRLSARRLGWRVHPVALWEDHYDRYVDLLMELHQRKLAADAEVRAFEVSDLTRARNLYEMLAESRIDLRSGVDEGLLQQEREVQERLNALEELRRRRLADEAPKGQIDDLDRKLRGLRLEFQEAQAQIRVRHPGFAEVRDPEPVRLEEIQEQLDPGTRLLSYVLGAERSFLFDVSRTGIRSVELKGRNELRRLAETAYRSLRFSEQRRARAQVWSALGYLADALLPTLDVSPYDHTSQVADRLLVVGEDMLLYIPFAVLPLPSPSGESVSAGDDSPDTLLMDRYEIVQLPSAASLVALRERSRERARPDQRIAVLADPVVTAGDDRLRESPGHGVREGGGASPNGPVTRLVHARREAESILARVQPEQRLAALGFAASYETATSEALGHYQILHFATHALIDEEHPELSGLVLSKFDRQGRPKHHSNLRLHEIYGLDLPVDMVVLSACSTALGERQRGEGLVGLTRGFFYAGASRLVVSLWDVDDEATAELMDRFYEELFDRELPPAAALREAQLRLRAEPRWQAPFYWAGFVLQGDWK